MVTSFVAVSVIPPEEKLAVTVTIWSLSIGGQESTPPVLIDAIWELTSQVGVTVDVVLSSQLAVAVYVAVPYSFIDDGPLMERPVKMAAGGGGATLLSPPPPPHVRRTNARKAKSIDAGRYVTRIFLISIPSLLTSPIEKRGDHDGHRRTDREGNPQPPANSKGLRKEKLGKNKRFSSLLGYHHIWTQIPGNRNRGTP